MKVVLISDTHEKHRGVTSLPQGDLLIHAGDFTLNGKIEPTRDFVEWFDNACAKYPMGGILIAGNHDLCLDENRTSPENYKIAQRLVKRANHFRYLDNANIILPNGLKVHGSPNTPWFYGNIWAFNKFEEQINPIWWRIPEDVDILVVHGPAWGIQDQLDASGPHLGCPRLRTTIDRGHSKLKLFVCGHIHRGYGVFVDPRDPSGRIFVNASLTEIVDGKYQLAYDPIVVDL